MRTVNLPHIPRSWDELTADQMVELNRIRGRATEKEFLFKAFCLLARIRLTRQVRQDEAGQWYNFFQQVDEKGKSYGEPFPMDAEQVNAIIEQNLTFLTHECDRLNDVFPVITLGGKRFHSAGYAMANLTYQQQQHAQTFWMDYIRYEQQAAEKAGELISQLKKTGKRPAIEDIRKTKAIIENQKKSLCYFLATVFTPESIVTERIIDGRHIKCDKTNKEHIFHVDQEQEADRFRKFDIYKGMAVMQHFGGVMLHYKKIFPLLFSEGADEQKTDYIKAETTTINALQSKLGFANYQTIYDSNAPFILGKLHEIIQEAKAIEKENARIKAHRKK